LTEVTGRFLPQLCFGNSNEQGALGSGVKGHL